MAKNEKWEIKKWDWDVSEERRISIIYEIYGEWTLHD